jgi:hypothetical protein
MSRWRLYDYVDERGVNSFKEWSSRLENKDLARLNSKLDMLGKEPTLPPQLLAGPLEGVPIYKLRINGRVALRPMLCKGPVDKDGEFTLLFGAFERDRKLVPRDAVSQAEARRQNVIANAKQRRCPHERVAKGT